MDTGWHSSLSSRLESYIVTNIKLNDVSNIMGIFKVSISYLFVMAKLTLTPPLSSTYSLGARSATNFETFLVRIGDVAIPYTEVVEVMFL